MSMGKTLYPLFSTGLNPGYKNLLFYLDTYMRHLQIQILLMNNRERERWRIYALIDIDTRKTRNHPNMTETLLNGCNATTQTEQNQDVGFQFYFTYIL